MGGLGRWLIRIGSRSMSKGGESGGFLLFPFVCCLGSRFGMGNGNIN